MQLLAWVVIIIHSTSLSFIQNNLRLFGIDSTYLKTVLKLVFLYYCLFRLILPSTQTIDTLLSSFSLFSIFPSFKNNMLLFNMLLYVTLIIFFSFLLFSDLVITLSVLLSLLFVLPLFLSFSFYLICTFMFFLFFVFFFCDLYFVFPSFFFYPSLCFLFCSLPLNSFTFFQITFFFLSKSAILSVLFSYYFIVLASPFCSSFIQSVLFLLFFNFWALYLHSFLFSFSLAFVFFINHLFVKDPMIPFSLLFFLPLFPLLFYSLSDLSVFFSAFFCPCSYSFSFLVLSQFSSFLYTTSDLSPCFSFLCSFVYCFFSYHCNYYFFMLCFFLCVCACLFDFPILFTWPSIVYLLLLYFFLFSFSLLFLLFLYTITI